jgi:hypothetical protein
MASQGAAIRQFSDRPGHSAASDRWRRPGFGLRVPLKHGRNRTAVGVLSAVPARPQIEDLGNHDRLLLNRRRGVQNLVRYIATDHEIDRSLV